MASAMENLRISHCFERVGVAASGTAERVAAAAGVRVGRYFQIKSKLANTGNVWVGFRSEMVGTTDGWPLDAGQETPLWPLPGGDAYNVWLDSTGADDDVVVLIFSAADGSDGSVSG